MTSPRLLPPEFKDLEIFVADWALATERERTAQRHRSDMTEIRAFYDAMLARLDEALVVLGAVSLDALTAEQKRLHHLTLSLCEIAPAVELYGQPAVVDGFDPARFPRVDIQNMTPVED